MSSFTGAAIRAARLARGWTQRQLAEAAGLSEIAIKRLEGGKNLPSGESLNRLAQALNVSTDTLMGRDDPLAGPFPAATLRAEGLGEEYLRRYERLWNDLRRDDRAWLIGHLRIVADAERRIRALEAAVPDDEPDSPLPARAQGAPVQRHAVA